MRERERGKHRKNCPWKFYAFHLLTILLAGKHGKCKSLQSEKSH